MAKAGVIALALDGLTGRGGCPGGNDQGRAVQRKVDGELPMEDFFVRSGYLATLMGWFTRWRRRGEGIVLLGTLRRYALLRAMAPLLAQHAALGSRMNPGGPKMQVASEADDKTCEAAIWSDVTHGIHTDIAPRHDDAAAGEDARLG